MRPVYLKLGGSLAAALAGFGALELFGALLSKHTIYGAFGVVAGVAAWKYIAVWEWERALKTINNVIPLKK